MQVFHRSTNTISRVSVFGAVFFLAVLLWLFYELEASPYTTRQYVAREQPVQFSHAHHVADDGIDCRYCHTSVEKAAFAGIPSTKICMNCHSQIWAETAYLEPVRESFRTGASIQWNRVNDLPDFVYFDHSIHVQKGIGCASCHGQVDEQPLALKAQPFNMGWCLDCHRAPQANLRPLDQITNMHWQPSADQATLGQQLFQQYHILGPDILTSCSTCHR
jgi:hypothetical protein